MAQRFPAAVVMLDLASEMLAGATMEDVNLRELMARIDSTDFIQVHRSVMVNSNAIMSATRDENGHYSLVVRGLQRPLKVSRAFGHLFRPM